MIGMEVERHSTEGGEEIRSESIVAPSSIHHDANQGASQHSVNPAMEEAPQPSSNAAIEEGPQPVELPANTAEQHTSQGCATSSPQTDIYHVEGITQLGPATPILSETIEQPAFLARIDTPTQHLRSETTNPCTSTITDPLELPVQPHQDGDFGLSEGNNLGDQGNGLADATAQAHLIMAAVAPPPAQLPGVITQIAPAMQPDNDLSDEAYAESTTTSFVTSIKSEVSRGVLENERLYPSYGQHDYGMPIDEDELDRMDLQHRKYEMVIGDKHFLAPIGPTPQRILDLGTGTGIWALDVADLYPSAHVIGVDIAPIQPKWTASNCQFEIDDVEEIWTFKDDSFDFIHFRDPLYVVRNWPKLMVQCYSHTKPGGWCELACIYPVPMCDDGTMPADSGFKVICDKFIEASYLFGAPADSPVRFAGYLRDAGFVDVAEHIFKVPSSPWPKDKRLKQIGALEMTNVVAGATAFGLRAFEKVFGWTKDETELAMVKFRRDVKNRHYHQYCQYFVVYGRKPSDPHYSDDGL